MYQWPFPTASLMPCHSEWHATCLSFSHAIIFMCSFFHFLLTSTGIVSSFTTESCSFAISTSWCGYCYWYHPHSLGLYFQGSGLPLSVSAAWSGSLCRAHIALQEFHTVAIMLHRMAFHLSGKVVALHLDNSTAKAYLCNQGGTVSPFLSRLACQILSLTDKPGITLPPAYIPTHLNVEADYLCWDQLLPE